MRGIQIHGKAAERAAAGERCALNLTGAELDVGAARRLGARATRSTTRRSASTRASPCSPRKRTRSSTGRRCICISRRATSPRASRRAAARAVAPGASAVVQLVLDQPIGALRGDRFILRDQSATRTLGGGFVLDPFAPATRRSSARATRASSPRSSTTRPRTRSPRCSQRATAPIDLAALRARLQPDAGARGRALRSTRDLVQLGKDARSAITQARYDARSATPCSRTLTEFHRGNPQAAGQEVETLRKAARARSQRRRFRAVLRRLADERKIEASGSTARLPGHNATANAADDRLWQTVRPALEAAGFNAPPIRELALQVKLKEADRQGFPVSQGEDRRSACASPPTASITRSTVATLAAVAQATAQAQPNGQFTAAQYRDCDRRRPQPRDRDPRIPRHARHHAAHRRRAQDAQGFRAHPRRGDRAAAAAEAAAPKPAPKPRAAAPARCRTIRR